MTLPYPVPILPDSVNTAGVHAHFRGLKKDPPPQLMPTWYVVVLRRMAGQNVDAECAELLQLERDFNIGSKYPSMDQTQKTQETEAQKAFRTFRESQRGK